MGWQRWRQLRAVVTEVAEQVGDLAFIEPGQPVERLERRGMTGLPWPLLPVGEVLERLRVVRPDLGPAFRGLRLAPAVRLPHRDPRVDTVRPLEDDPNLRPRVAFLSQLCRMQRLCLSY